MVEWIVFGGLVSGLVGCVLGLITDKGWAGFFLGAFLGPIGWIIVFLLPKDEEATTQTSQQSVSRTNAPERDLSSDAYKIWLGKTYSIVKNDLFEKYECDEKLFDTLDEAISYADRLEREKRLEDERRLEERETISNPSSQSQGTDGIEILFIAGFFVCLLFAIFALVSNL